LLLEQVGEAEGIQPSLRKLLLGKEEEEKDLKATLEPNENRLQAHLHMRKAVGLLKQQEQNQVQERDSRHSVYSA
jgi:hypothetical protein